MIDDTIIQKLNDKDPSIRINAIINLHKLGLADASETLISMLDEDDAELRQSIISTLLTIGKPAIPFLIDALRFPNILVQKSAAKILSEVGDASISGDILNLLKNPNSTVRAVVLEVLGGIKDFWSIAYIREFISDPEPNVRATAVRALGNLEDKLSIDLIMSLLTDNDVNVRIAAIESLNKFSEARVCDALWQVIERDDNQKVKDTALLSLKNIGEKILKPYENSFTSNDVSVRSKILQELSAFGRTVLIPLIDFSKHHSPSAREICAEILGNIGDNLATRRLIELTNDTEQSVRLAAITALGKIKSETALRHLISILKNPNPIISSSASQSLTKAGRDVVKFLPGLISEQDLNTQILMSQLIGNLGDPDVVSILAEHLHTPQMWLRRALCNALGETRNPLAANVLIEQGVNDSETLVRTAAVKALGKLKVTVGINALINALHDKEETVQLAAIEALGEMGESSVGSFLIPYLSANSFSLKISAIRALTRLNYYGAIQILKSLARPWPFGKESDEIRNEARVALKKLVYEFQMSKPG